MAGSKVGEVTVKCAQKLRDVGRKAVRTVASGAKRVVGRVVNGVKDFCRGFASFLGF